MSDTALLFAILTGFSAAGHAISVHLGSSGITPAAGAVIVGAVALGVNLTVLGVLKLRGEPLLVTPAGLMWVLPRMFSAQLRHAVRSTSRSGRTIQGTLPLLPIAEDA